MFFLLQVLSNIWAAHHNPNDWTEPDKFIPERHLDDEGNFISRNKVVVFGAGPRQCIGEQMARMEMFIFLVSLIQRFTFHLDPACTEPPDVNSYSPSIICSPSKFNLVAKER